MSDESRSSKRLECADRPGESFTTGEKLGSKFWLALIGGLLAICIGALLLFVLVGAA